jgi:hypothetical protein
MHHMAGAIVMTITAGAIFVGHMPLRTVVAYSLVAGVAYIASSLLARLILKELG